MRLGIENSMKETVESLTEHFLNNIHFHFSYKDIRAEKNPFDLWIYQEMIYKFKPDVIVEIGSFHGGSTLFLADQINHLGRDGFVISVDCDRTFFKPVHRDIQLVTGDSVSPKVIEEVRERIGDKGRNVMVIHDGDHSADHVYKDLCLYNQFVSVGNYFIVEDGIVDLMPKRFAEMFPNGGPIVGINKFVQENKNFEIDRSWEKFVITFNPNGYLKRIK